MRDATERALRLARVTIRALRVVAALVVVAGVVITILELDQYDIVDRDIATWRFEIASALRGLIAPLGFGGLLFAASVALDLWTAQLRRLSER